MSNFIKLTDLEVYKLSRELSRIGWEIYQQLNWQDKKIMGDQFIESTDSVGANIAEGYARFHFLDKIKFFYNARGSLVECSEHWVELLKERNKTKTELCANFKKVSTNLSLKLNNFISSTYKAKTNETR